MPLRAGRDTSVLVVGAGIMGLSTAWALTKRGHKVTVLEKGAAIPNPLSASGDEHRMIRRAYGDDDGYARTITEAYDAWDEMWADLGESHYAERGVLVVSQQEGDNGDKLRAGLDRIGSPYELMPAKDAAQRYKFLDPQAFRYAFFSRDGGALLSRRIAAGLAAWLRAHGADLRTGVRITGIDGDAARVTAEDGQVFQAARVVVTVGAWTSRLFPDMAAQLATYRTSVVYLNPPEDLREAWADAPCILSRGPIDGYILPPVDGAGLKMGASINKRRTTNPDADRAEEPGEGEALRDVFAAPFARIGEYTVQRVATCTLDFTADDRFVGREIGAAGLLVSACSGHGYKFGAAIGRRVADAVESGDVARLARWLRAEQIDYPVPEPHL